ncbi:MAG: sigma-54 dependent transcriptional regulator [Polyangia bacterium]
MSGRILVADDDRSMCELLQAGLARRGFEVSWRTDATTALAAISEGDFDVIVTDLNMPEVNGLELCERVTANRPDVPVVVITAFGSLDTAVAAIRAGAYDFITKPFEMDGLRLTLDRAVQHHRLRDEVKRLRQAVTESRGFGEILANSPLMRRVLDLVNRAAESDATALITGESGTGKELVARALHQHSRRHDGPFVAVSCAAMPEALLESELFGHVRGAFTDARTPRTGLLLQANGGTLLLDEIGDMPLGLQPKLLRAIEDRRLRPLGENTERPFDVRLVCATNRDLEADIEENRFRADLFYRINVIHVELPPLRARDGDILPLAQHFVQHFSRAAAKPVTGVSTAAAERLLAYTWPGNVRELRNCIERAVALTRFEEIAVEDLPEKVQNYRQSRVVVDLDDTAHLASMEEVERRYILRVLEAAGGQRTKAAQILGLDRKTLYRKLERWGVSE